MRLKCDSPDVGRTYENTEYTGLDTLWFSLVLANTNDLTQTLCILAKTSGLGGFSSVLRVSTGDHAGVAKKWAFSSSFNNFTHKLCFFAEIVTSCEYFCK